MSRRPLPDRLPISNPSLRILPCGDSALTVEFGDTVDPELNDLVLALDAHVAETGHTAIIETVPTYRSLMVHYDCNRIGFAALSDWLRERVRTAQGPSPTRAHWRVPVVYGGDFGEDLASVAERHGLTPDEVIARHSAAEYRVYMLGFMPGYTYLGGLDPVLATPRRAAPRLSTPAGSIAIGGVQASIQCLAAPSGWHLLGRTPVRTFHPSRQPMFLISPGDAVSFYPIPPGAWDELHRASEAGEMVAHRVTP